MKRRMKRVGHKKHGNTCWKNMLSEHSGSCQFPNIKIFHGGICQCHNTKIFKKISCNKHTIQSLEKNLVKPVKQSRMSNITKIFDKSTIAIYLGANKHIDSTRPTTTRRVVSRDNPSN